MMSYKTTRCMKCAQVFIQNKNLSQVVIKNTFFDCRICYQLSSFTFAVCDIAKFDEKLVTFIGRRHHIEGT